MITIIFLRGWGDEKLHPLHSFKSTAKYWILSLAAALVLPRFLVWLDKLTAQLKAPINQAEFYNEDEKQDDHDEKAIDKI